MRLLSKPSDFDFNQFKTYQIFKNFRLAITERSWIGEIFVPKSEGNWFIDQLYNIEEELIQELGLYGDFTKFDYLIDTSVFYNNYNSNESLLSLFEEINQFILMDKKDANYEKNYKNYLRKLRNYANKQENYPYILRWYFYNKENILAEELYNFVLSNVKEYGLRGKNFLIKSSKRIHQESISLRNKNYSKEEIIKISDNKMTAVVSACEKNESEYFSKLLKHAFEDVSLFYFSTYLISLFYKELSSVSDKGSVFLSVEQNKKGISVFLKDSTPQLNDFFLMHESFLKTFPRHERDSSGRFQIYQSLYHLKEYSEDEYEAERLEVLKTIVSWVVSRIPDNKLNVLPKEQWIHYIKGDFLKNEGFAYLRFESNELIGGYEGIELLIKSIAYKKDGERILFPVFDPSSWDNLNALQCNLIAYAICLYHDICIENNYELVPLQLNDSNKLYELITKDHSIQSSLYLNNTLSQKSQKGYKKSEEEKIEHWVSFHFRRLRIGQNASVEARERAKKYGIKKLPRGFTFVDSFVRGERTTDLSKMRISALEVLNRTVNKIKTYDKVIDTVNKV